MAVKLAGVYIIIFTSLVLLPTLTRASNLPSLDYHNKETIKGQVCYRSSLYIQKTLGDLSYPSVFDEWPKKPATVSINSPCYGMEATCCTSEKEKQVSHAMVLVEYSEKLQAAFDKKAKSCHTMGRQFERILYNNMKESINLLKTEVSGILHSEVNHELFKQLADYMYTFVYTRDFCPLKENIVNQFKLLFRYTVQLQMQDRLEQQINNDDCLANLEDYYTSVWENDTIQYFMQSLNNIRLMEESFELLKSLVINLRSHKWSPECTSALFTIRHCAYCVGYSNFQHCDGNCLNALRGCTSDMAELDKHLHQLRGLILKIGHFVHNEFHPVKLVESVLFGYVKIVRQLAAVNITHMINTGCQIDEEKQSQQSITTLQYAARTFTNNQLLTVIQNDFECVRDLESLLVQLPEEMCGVDHNHFAYLRKRECWNGTARASYNEPIVGPYKSDQINNPSYTHNPLPLYNNSLQHHINNIHLLERDINKTLNYYTCYDESDDEDCSIRFVLSCQAPRSLPIDIETGSGSGSGSGHGSTEKDTEKPNHNKESVVIELGGKRRFDDSGNHDDKTTPTINLVQYSTTQSSSTQKSKTIPSSKIHNPPQTTPSTQATPTQTTPPPVIILPSSPIVIIDPPQQPRGSSSHASFSIYILLITLLITIFVIIMV